ncbi:hypothetical protein GCM10020367_58810 [Streptomyces sannanensis]|uniref:Uncharacterized protein n=1 Tax=Streptomyces sannanensis TaxID=285536 RepID=A0ABP6SJP7_9ACTN
MLCPRDAKMHRIGSLCTTLNWPESELLDYLRERLADQETDASVYDAIAYHGRESFGIPHPSVAEQEAAQAEWGQRTAVIKAAIAACEERIASS